jgi:hypothetical protein
MTMYHYFIRRMEIIESSWWNPTKFYKKKAPKKGKEKETRGKDQSPCKQTTQKRWATKTKGNQLRTKPSSNCMKHIN